MAEAQQQPESRWARLARFNTVLLTCATDAKFSHAQVDEIWINYFTAFDVNVDDREIVRDEFYSWALVNTTSTSQQLQSECTVLGQKKSMRTVLSAMKLPLGELRRFLRNAQNIKALNEVVLNDPVVIATLKQRAAENGVDPNCYRVVSDLFDYFPNKTPAELAAAVVFKKRRDKQQVVKRAIVQEALEAGHQPHAGVQGAGHESSSVFF